MSEEKVDYENAPLAAPQAEESLNVEPRQDVFFFGGDGYYRPLNDQVLVELVIPELRTPGGIIKTEKQIKEEMKNFDKGFTVLAVGDQALHVVSVGQKVLPLPGIQIQQFELGEYTVAQFSIHQLMGVFL